MKKSLYLGALALLTLASCASEETVEAPKGNAIDFGKAFINNSTRGGVEITLDKLTSFNVYGYMGDMSGVIFNNELVKLAEGKWTYDAIQYWTPGKNYAFAAIAPKTGVTFTAPTTFPTSGEFGTIAYKTDGTNDLIYAAQYATGKESGNTPVAFTFNHLLSRVKLTFNNTMTNPKGSMTISAVKISGVYNDGTIELAGTDAAWTVGEAATATGERVYTMDAEGVAAQGKNVASDFFFFIPTTGHEYTITFTVKQKIGDVVVSTSTKKAKITLDMQRGYSYNLTADLNELNMPQNTPEPIEFTVTAVEDWQNWTDNNGMRF